MSLIPPEPFFFRPPTPEMSLWEGVRQVGRMLVNAGGLFGVRGKRTANVAASATLHGWHTDDAAALVLELGEVERLLETLLVNVRAARARVRDIDTLGYGTLAHAYQAQSRYGALGKPAAEALARLSSSEIPFPKM